MAKNTISMDNSNDLYFLVKWIIAWVTGGVTTAWGVNKAIDRYFDYKIRIQEKMMDERANHQIDERVMPKIDRLDNSIEKLTEAVTLLKDKIK